MNAFLSYIIALMLLVTGGSATSARNMTVENVALDLAGSRYELDVSATAGVSAVDGGSLLDFHMTDADGDFLPVQVKFTDEGIALMVSSDTAYLLTADYLGETLGITEENASMFESLASMYENGLPGENIDKEALIAAIDARLAPIMEGASVIETSTVLPDTEDEVPATATAFVLDNETVCGLIDDIYTVTGMNNAISGITASLGGTDFTSMMEAVGAKMSAPCVVTKANDSDYMTVEAQLTIDVTENDETVTVIMPMYISLIDEDSGDVSIYFDQDGVSYQYIVAFDGDYYNLNMNLTYTDPSVSETSADETADETDAGEAEISTIFAMYATGAPTKDGSVVKSAGFALYTEGMLVNADASQLGNVIKVAATYATPSANIFSASFDIVLNDEPIEDRVSGAELTTVSSDDDEVAMIIDIAASVQDDILRLSENESVTKVVDAVTSYAFEEVSSTESMAIEEGEVEEYVYSEDPADLSFGIPEFTVLPEGYELTETSAYVDMYNENLYMTFTRTGDELGASISCSFEKSAEAGESAVYVLDGDTMTQVDGTVVSTYTEEGWSEIKTSINGITVYMYVYGQTLTPDEIASMVAGIRF